MMRVGVLTSMACKLEMRSRSACSVSRPVPESGAVVQRSRGGAGHEGVGVAVDNPALPIF